MSDTQLRDLARTWREARTIGAAAAFVAARLRRGAAGEDERAAWREAITRGDHGAAEELFLDACLRDDTADARRALETLDSPPGHAVEFRKVDLYSGLACPISLRWPRPSKEGTPAERFVAGWLATMPHVERVLVWCRVLLAEPVVTDEERRAILDEALAGARVDVDALSTRHAAITETITKTVVYMTPGADHLPPMIVRTFPMLIHDLLRRGLLLDARSEAGLAGARTVVRTLLERPRSLLPSRCEIRLAERQTGYRWAVASHGGGPELDEALAAAAAGQVDSHPLRAALSLIRSLRVLLLDPRIRAAVDWLVAEGAEREAVRRALALHLIPGLPHLPPRLALALIKRSATWTTAPPSFVMTLLRRAEGYPAEQREAAAGALVELASRGGRIVEAFEDTLPAALTSGAPWPDSRVARRVPLEGPGPWLRALAPRLVRALSTSSDPYARSIAAVMSRSASTGVYADLIDVWLRLAEDEDGGVRAGLRGRADP